MPQSGQVVFSRMEEVQFGKPAAATVAELVKRQQAERVFLMVSGTLNRDTDEIEKLRRALGNHCVGTFDKMPPHTPRSAVIAAAGQARDARADLIVTLGGGSITDGAKAVQLCLANDVTSVDGMDRIRGSSDAKPPTVRQVSIPTTLSAGEFSGLAGVTNEATKVKEMFRHPLTIPQAVIPDPGDMKARLDCQTGSWLSMGGLAAGVPMGASHGIGYVLGAVFDVPHGHTSCIMLPAVMRWNKPANAHSQALIANAMGHPGKDAADVLDDFIRGLGMPRSLAEVKVGREHFERIAQQAMGTPWVPRNP